MTTELWYVLFINEVFEVTNREAAILYGFLRLRQNVPMTYGEIRVGCPGRLSRNTVIRSLKILEDAGFLKTHQRGIRRYYDCIGPDTIPNPDGVPPQSLPHEGLPPQGTNPTPTGLESNPDRVANLPHGGCVRRETKRQGDKKTVTSIQNESTTSTDPESTKKKSKTRTKAGSVVARDIYDAYPLHRKPLTAIKAIEKALGLIGSRNGSEAVADAGAWLLMRTESWAGHCRSQPEFPKFIDYPATWFNGGGYDGEWDEESGGDTFDEEPDAPLPADAAGAPPWET